MACCTSNISNISDNRGPVAQEGPIVDYPLANNKALALPWFLINCCKLARDMVIAINMSPSNADWG